MSGSGVRHVWRTMPAAILLNLSLGSLYAWSIFVDPLAGELEVTKASLSTVFALAIATFAISTAVLPKYLLIFRAYIIATLSAFIAAVGLAISAIGQSLWIVCVGYGFLFGLANGIGYALALQLVNDSLPHRRGLATGISVASYAFGAILFAPLFQRGVDHLGVWQTFGSMALWMILSAGVLLILLQPLQGTFKQMVVSATGIIRLPQTLFWILWTGFFFGSAMGLMILGHEAGLVATYGGTSEAIAAGTALIAGCNCIGRLSSGWLSDHMPIRLILSSSAALGAMALGTFSLVPCQETVFVALLGVGLSYGLLAAGFASAVAHLYGTRHVAVVFGRLMTAWGAAGLLSPILAGFILDLTASYSTAALVAAAFAVAAALTGLAVSSPRSNNSV